MEDGFPVITKFVNELPDQKIMDEFQYLVVVSWKYSEKKSKK